MRVGPYIVEERVGTGGVGAVWRVRHADSGHDFALKALALDRGRGSAEDLRAELMATARLDHRHIVGIRDFGTFSDDVDTELFTPGAPWLVLEWMGGGTLRSRLGEMDWAATRGLLRALLDGMAHAHGQRVLHRDLKPENVLCGSVPPDWRIADFGIALYAGAGTGPKMARGTPPYMAPEQTRKSALDQGPWTDLYALGCMAWEVVTGAPPFVGDARSVLRQHRYSALPEFRPRFSVPEGLELWLRALLAKAPLDRPHFAVDARYALDRLGSPDVVVEWSAPITTTADTWKTLPTAVLPDLPTEEVATTEGAHLRFPPPPLAPVRDPPGPDVLDDDLIRVSRSPDIGLLGEWSILPAAIGRSEVKDRLWAELVAARRDERLHGFVLYGSPGMGRSRMSRWLGTRTHELGQSYMIRIQAGSSHRFPLRQAFAIQLGLAHLAAPMAALKLTDMLPNLSSDQAEGAVHALRSQEAISVDALVPLCTGLADLRALLLVVDDVLLDPESLALIEALADITEPLPLLVLTTVGDDQATDEPALRERLGAWARRVGASESRLGPMGKHPWRALIMDQTGLTLATADELGRVSGYNPGAGRALLRQLQVDGRLQRTELGFQVQGHVALPVERVAELARRTREALSELTPVERKSLAVAALLGSPGPPGALERCLERLGLSFRMASVRRLAREGLVTPAGDRFELPSEPVCQAVLAEERPDPRTCEVVAEVLSDGPALDPLHVGRVLYLAQEWDRAARWLERGILEQLDRSLVEGVGPAVDRLQPALEGAGIPRSDPRWATVWAARATVAGFERDIDSLCTVEAQFTAEVERHGWNPLETGAAEVRARAGTWTWELSEVVAYLERCLDILCRPNGFAVRAFYLLARIAPGQGRPRLALRAHQRALEAADATGLPWLRATTLYGMGIHLLESGEVDEGESWLDRAMTVLEDPAIPADTRARLSGNVWNARGEAARRRGNFAAAIGWYRRAWRSYRSVMDEASVAALLNLGAALIQSGQDLEGRLALERRGGDPWVRNSPILDQCRRTMLIAACAGQRDWRALDRELDEFERALEETPHVDPEFPIMLGLAADRARAADSFRRVLRLRELARRVDRALAGQGSA